MPMLVFAAVGFAVLPLRAEGQRTAYLSFAIALVAGLITGVVIQRLHLSDKPGNVDVWIVVAVGLLVTSLAPPTVESAIIGLMSGFLGSFASMMLIERRSARRNGG